MLGDQEEEVEVEVKVRRGRASARKARAFGVDPITHGGRLPCLIMGAYSASSLSGIEVRVYTGIFAYLA